MHEQRDQEESFGLTYRDVLEEIEKNTDKTIADLLLDIRTSIPILQSQMFKSGAKQGQQAFHDFYGDSEEIKANAAKMFKLAKEDGNPSALAAGYIAEAVAMMQFMLYTVQELIRKRNADQLEIWALEHDPPMYNETTLSN